jgi:hypothetical protein
MSAFAFCFLFGVVAGRLNGSGRHRAVYSFLRFELLDKCSKVRGDGCCDCVVLILEPLSNHRQ